MKGLLRRLVTAIFFVIVMLGGLYGGRYSFVFLVALVTALCLWEFLGMMLTHFSSHDRIRRLFGLTLGLVPHVLAAIIQLGLVHNSEKFIAIASLLIFPIIFLAFIYELYCHSQQPFTNISHIILGMIYIGVPFAMLDFIAFHENYFYANTVFGLLLLSWSNDTGAYVIGSLFGRHRLFPRISPKKTWEGTIGGIAVTVLIAWILSRFFNELSTVDWMVMGGIVGIFGTFGDLVESMLKRSREMKDSGDLLPGHGGVLDRLDSLSGAAPVFALGLLLAGW